MKALKIVLLVVAILLVIVIAVGGYFGFVPGVRTLFGSDKPRDLGVVASAESFKSGEAKVGLARQDTGAATAGTVTYQGSHQVNVSLTSAELTSLMQGGSWKQTWQYNPIADGFQVKFHPDGTVEVAGVLDRTKLVGYLDATGFKDVVGYVNSLGFLPNTIPFYANGSGSIVNNNVTVSISNAELGRVTLPTDASAMQAVQSFVERRIAGIPGLNVASLNFNGGTLNFKGTYPSVIKF
jgi:hypothetical protein